MNIDMIGIKEGTSRNIRSKESLFVETICYIIGWTHAYNLYKFNGLLDLLSPTTKIHLSAFLVSKKSEPAASLLITKNYFCWFSYDSWHQSLSCYVHAVLFRWQFPSVVITWNTLISHKCAVSAQEGGQILKQKLRYAENICRQGIIERRHVLILSCLCSHLTIKILEMFQLF